MTSKNIHEAANESINFDFITQLLDSHYKSYHHCHSYNVFEEEHEKKIFFNSMKITENEFYIKSTYSKIDEGRKMSKRENGLEVNFSDCITMKK